MSLHRGSAVRALVAASLLALLLSGGAPAQTYAPENLDARSPSGSAALGVNASGQAVGIDGPTGPLPAGRAVLYTWNGKIDLNMLVDPMLGWNLVAATGIANDGRIVGYGYQNGAQHAFRLTPQFGGQLEVSPPSLSFVVPVAGVTQSLSVSLRNAGTAPIAGEVDAMLGVYTTTAGAGRFFLRPGEAKTVTVKFDPSRSGSRRDDLPIFHSDPTAMTFTQVPLSGTISPPPSPNPGTHTN